jgi:hypothetical protein
MESLNKQYYKYTGIQCDIEKLISECSSEEEQLKLYRNLSWHLQRGVMISNNKSKKTQEFGKLLSTIANNLNITLKDDMDNDGDIDDTDKKLFDELNNAKDILSSLDITTEPVTEEVTEPVTEEVTEPVTEEVTEPVTEKVTEPVTEEVTEEVTEPVTEEVNEPVTEKVTEE